MKELKVAKTRPEARIPTRKHPTDAGMDLYSCGEYFIGHGSFALVDTGITVELPKGFVGIIKPKGASQHLIGSGVLDAGYQGEIVVRVFNAGATMISFKPGDPVGQLVILPVMTPEIVEVSLDEIHQEKSARGATGGIHQYKQATLISDVFSLEEKDYPKFEINNEK